MRKKEQDLRTLYIRFGKREGEGKEAKLPTTGRQGHKLFGRQFPGYKFPLGLLA